MKIKIKEKNDSVILLNLKLAWDYIESDYIDVENKALSNSKEKGARKGKLMGIQKEIFLKNNRDYINSSFVDHAVNIYYRKALQEKNIIPINQGKVSELKFEGVGTNFEHLYRIKISSGIQKSYLEQLKTTATVRKISKHVRAQKNNEYML